MPTTLSTMQMTKHTPGKRDAVQSIARIQFWPPERAYLAGVTGSRGDWPSAAAARSRARHTRTCTSLHVSRASMPNMCVPRVAEACLDLGARIRADVIN